MLLSISGTVLATILTITSGVLDTIHFLKDNPTNVSGEWNIENTIKTSAKESYIGAVTGFKLFLQQNGNLVTGEGEKLKLNNYPVPNSQRIRVSLEGTIEGNSLYLTFKEYGILKTTVGAYTWKVTGNSLKGMFVSTAAKTEGESRGIRLSKDSFY